MSISGRISEHASDKLASDKLVSEVYNIMTNDMITEVAQGDPLIISLGNLWLMKNAGNKLKHTYYTSSRMKGAARLLLNLRKLTGTSEPMSYFLNQGSYRHGFIKFKDFSRTSYRVFKDYKLPKNTYKISESATFPLRMLKLRVKE